METIWTTIGNYMDSTLAPLGTTLSQLWHNCDETFSQLWQNFDISLRQLWQKFDRTLRQFPISQSLSIYCAGKIPTIIAECPSRMLSKMIKQNYKIILLITLIDDIDYKIILIKLLNHFCLSKIRGNHYFRMPNDASGNSLQKWPQGHFQKNISDRWDKIRAIKFAGLVSLE